MSSAPSTPAKSAMSEPGTPKTYRDLPLLTPRSKVKAMLAELSEDDSEEEGDVLSKSKNIRPSTTESSKPTKEAPLFIGSESEDELESDKEPVRPRGRLANRMMARESDSKKTGGSAYERVKASIFGGGEGEKEAAKETSKITNQLKDSDTQEGEDEDDEDEDIPIAPRRKRPLRKLLSPPRALSNSPASSPKSSGSNAPAPANEDSEDELPENLFKNARFQALVEKKRQERREKEEQRKQKALEERWRKLDAQLGCGSSSEDEDSGAEKLTQRAPRRKAGKKAIEEMHRETQRMARNMQLAHRATTKMKITKQSLFDKFNFRPSNAPPPKEDAEQKTDAPSALSPGLNGSDKNQNKPVSTPQKPTKPLPLYPSKLATEEQLPTLQELLTAPEEMDASLDPPSTPKPENNKGKGKSIQLSSDEESTPRPKFDKGKGKAIEEPSPKQKFLAPPIRVIYPPKKRNTANDSDSDLEIIDLGDEKTKEVSERQKSIMELKATRKLKSPARAKADKLHMTTKQLQAELLRKSRLQALREREDRIAELKAKGIIVPTAEEREKERKEIEDLVEKARQEALEIKRREKRAEQKKKGGKIGDVEDDEEDEEWLEDEVLESEFSGSEEEEEDQDGDEMDVDEDVQPEEKEDEPAVDENYRISLSAMPSAQPTSAQPSLTHSLSDVPAAYVQVAASDDDEEPADDFFAPLKRKVVPGSRKKKSRVIIDDDDDEDEISAKDMPSPPPKIPAIFQKAALNSVDGLTQLFNGTLASGSPGFDDSPRDSGLDALRKPLGEELPNSQAPQNIFDASQDIVWCSQPTEIPARNESQSVMEEHPVLPALNSIYENGTQSQMPDPTPDQGFGNSPAPRRFDSSQVMDSPSGTIPSGTIPSQILDSQLGRKKGRLTRRYDFSDSEEEADDDRDIIESVEEAEEEEEEDIENVFDRMKKAAKAQSKKEKRSQIDDFDRTKSNAKEMVQEQAEESEDEYAGIGGVSDDEANDAHDSDLESMIDDSTDQPVNESEIAAFYAEREKIQDEKDVNKLFRDIQGGLLRRKRGMDFDLDDSDSDGEARRRAKRRQIAKMRKALLEDEKLGKIASNPRKLAFLNAIEDRDRDDDMDFLDKCEEDSLDLEVLTPEQSSWEAVKEEGKEEGNVDSQGSAEGDKEVKAKVNRRPVKTSKPSLHDVRETLSFLVEESESQSILAADSDSDPELTIRKTRRSTAVIDRTTLSRSASTISASTTKMAFQITSSVPGFKVPALVRRATAGFETASEDSQSKSTSQGTERGAGDVEKAVKRGGKASSSINFHQREQERRKAIEVKGERNKKALRKEREQRKGVLGMLTKGDFS